jgi:hypothetical protein
MMTPYFAAFTASGYELYEDGVLIYSDEMARKEDGPQIPPEVHNTRPFDPLAAWKATAALCEGV